MEDQHLAAALAAVLEMDLGSADGRAGVMTLLRQINEQAPGTVEQMAAHLQLRRLGLSTTQLGHA